MNKQELIDQISEAADLSKIAASKAIDAFTQVITDTLSAGDSVALVGFGTWDTAVRSARQGRNPQTGKAIQIKEARVPRFKAGKCLKDAVNDR